VDRRRMETGRRAAKCVIYVMLRSNIAEKTASFSTTPLCLDTLQNSTEAPQGPPIQGLARSRKVQNSRLESPKKSPQGPRIAPVAPSEP
jgi:hypothetical protein